MTHSSETKQANPALKNAIFLGFICIFSYLASYCIRQLLAVATPEMLETGNYTETYLGLLASVYFWVYAMGQFINGQLGDKINPKYMVSIGLTVTATAITFFPLVPFQWMQVTCFVLMGIGLSMLRGPIMKTVSENLVKSYARVICAILSAISFVGPIVASTLAILFQWDTMFIVAGLCTYIIAAIAFVALTILERKKIFTFHKNQKAGFGSYLQLFKLEHFPFFMVVGGIVEISASAITFWIPTYLSDALHLDSVVRNILFSVSTSVTCIAPFFALFVYNLIKVKGKNILMIRCGFLLAAVSFLCMILVPGSYVKIVFLSMARFFTACCSTILWSIYIPGMGKTGRVSSINGVINCTGYLSAAIANTVFSMLVGLSWTGIILIWCGIVLVGFLSALLVKPQQSA